MPSEGQTSSPDVESCGTINPEKWTVQLAILSAFLQGLPITNLALY